MKKIMIVLGIISIVLVILLSVGHYIILSHINRPGVTYWNDKRVAFENDTGKDILVKAYFAEGLLYQIEYNEVPKMLLPYMLGNEPFYSPFFSDEKVVKEKKYIFDKYPIDKKFFSVLVPSDTTLFFGDAGLFDIYLGAHYSHFEFAMMKNGETMKSAGIQFDQLYEMKRRCLAPNSRTKCPIKASEIFKD